MKMLRTLTEHISREKSLKRKVTIGNKKFSLLVSPDAQLKYLKLGNNAFDRDLIAIAQKYIRPSSNVWDIGANVGVFTFASAIIADKGSVVAVEADTWLVNLLRKTARFEEYADRDIHILPAAISDKNSIASFLIAERGRASNSLASSGGLTQMGGVREKQYVPTLTMDTLLETFLAPDFIKIDVEGAECRVLKGATRIIDEIRPIFYVEVDQRSFTEISAIFRAANYFSCDFQGTPVVAEGFCNIFFIPAEKKELYAAQ